VLQGFCDTCGHKVARVIDDLAPAPKKKAKATAPGLYIFDVWLYGDEDCTEEKRDSGDTSLNSCLDREG